ncbi:hypothetical protein [Sphingosinicella sp. BN140058]|uniref:hypothetical protein n=1 Tax=Sphingosinicella sp. BN140058 TaxID=1892855 RepID=UPI001010EEEC|nr:hypothetical protein [Sphingosinicella sp. BN140058]QAY78159.1 hypothetical protein ETR14_17715 [Sphingosinicella sp. BN140058]
MIVLSTIGLMVVGLNLLDGSIELRRLGHVGATGTPFRFTLVIVGYGFCWAMTILGWICLRSEWKMNYRPRAKLPFERQDFRRSL